MWRVRAGAEGPRRAAAGASKAARRGRCNPLGHTPALAALFYSLMETARLCGEDPGRYLLRAALVAIENPGTVTLPSSAD